MVLAIKRVMYSLVGSCLIMGCSIDAMIAASLEGDIEVVLSSTAPTTNNLSAIPVTVTLSRHVETLDPAFFIVVNGTISDFSGVGKTYSLNLIPASDGIVSIMTPPTDVSVVAKIKTRSSNVLSFNVDRSQLAVSVIGPEPAMGTTATNYVWTVTYTGADSITLSSDDVLLGGTAGTCTDKTVAGTGNIRTVTVGGCTSSGALKMALAAQTAQDSEGHFVGTAQGAGQAEVVEPIEVSMAETSDVLPRSLGIETQSVGVRLSRPAPVDVQVHYSLISAFTTTTSQQNDLPEKGYIVIPAGSQVGLISYQFRGSIGPVGSQVIQVALTGVTGAGGAAYIGKQIFRRMIFDGLIDPQAESIAVGKESICAIFSGGFLRCWGGNTYGQLGNGGTDSSPSPGIVSGGSGFIAISQWGDHACGLVTGGELRCWGRNNEGQVGNNSLVDQLTPTVIDSGVSYAAVAAGETHTCGLTQDGDVKCWGNNAYGQLGDGTTDSRLVPVPVNDPGVTYKAISAGERRSCGITEDDVLKCWGYNGNLGTGDTGHKLVPVEIDSGVPYKQISVGQIICGITLSSQVKCWGGNSNGQVGDGTTMSKSTPVAIDTGVLYEQVSVGRTMNCGVTSEGVLKCWGAGLYDGKQGQKTIPTVMENSRQFSAISANWGTYCGISEEVVSCWGSDNTKGQMGNGFISNFTYKTPTTVRSSNVSQVVLSLDGFGCSLDNLGALSCWGSNISGQLGDWSTTGKTTPVLIDAGVSYKSVSLGVGHSCGITKSDTLKCWGVNNNGQLGLGHMLTVLFPTEVNRGQKYSMVASGRWHTCALTVDGKIECWGRNQYGQVGDGTTTDRLIPVVIDEGSTYKYVAAGDAQSCGITTAGQMKCWGYAGLGDGSSDNSSLPVEVDVGETYKSVAVAIGGAMICGIKDSGTLTCWAASGMIGDGTTGTQLTPVVVDGGTQYKSVAVHSNGSCGITIHDKVKCWGVLYGDVSDVSYLPVIMDSTEYYKNIFVNAMTKCGVTLSGVQKCWGINFSGIFGLGELYGYASPIKPN